MRLPVRRRPGLLGDCRAIGIDLAHARANFAQALLNRLGGIRFDAKCIANVDGVLTRREVIPSVPRDVPAGEISLARTAIPGSPRRS